MALGTPYRAWILVVVVGLVLILVLVLVLIILILILVLVLVILILIVLILILVLILVIHSACDAFSPRFCAADSGEGAAGFDGIPSVVLLHKGYGSSMPHLCAFMHPTEDRLPGGKIYNLF